METKQIHTGTQSDASPRHFFSDGPKSAAPLAWLTAALLILTGAAFEFGMLGFGPYNSSDVWLLSVLAKNVWITVLDLLGPQLLNFLSTWPIVLVSLGSAILLVTRRRNRFDSRYSSGPQERTHHAN